MQTKQATHERFQNAQRKKVMQKYFHYTMELFNHIKEGAVFELEYASNLTKSWQHRYATVI